MTKKLTAVEAVELAAAFVEAQTRGGTGEVYSNVIMFQAAEIKKAFWAAVASLEA